MKVNMPDSRFDFRQGRNTAVSPDLLNPSELVDSTNVRIDTAFGGLTKRTGTRRLHPTALPSVITGVFQWDVSAGTKELVAASNGDFYHKTSALGDFTHVVPATAFSSSKRQTWQTFRNANSSGASLKLYIAGDRYYSWDGTTLTVLAPAGMPTDVDIIVAHATRMFARSISFKKTLYWSKVGDSENWLASGLPSDAGAAPVQVLTGEEINALEVIGGSLLIGAQDSVSRFTGTNSDNITLSTDTLGLSTEIGPNGVNALKRFETAAALLSERGPHVVTEAGIAPIGVKIEPDFLAITPANLPQCAIGYHRGRKEIWFAIPGSGDGGINKTIYVYSTRLQSWMGPWTYSFDITAFARYEDSNGAENLVAACGDGFVRLMDDVGSYLDDRHSDGTGGSNIAMLAEPSPHFWAAGAGTIKSLDKMLLDADLPASSALHVKTSFDGAAFTDTTVASAGSGLLPYRVDLSDTGKRMRLQFTDASAFAPVIYGYTIKAWDMLRQ